VFGQSLCELAKEDKRIVGITAAMPTGTGLTDFAKFFPDRFFDVGIAEEHAITMAAALAAGGIRPVVAIYSSFLQRAYDQLLHDVCLQNLPVVIGVDRSGLVGEDGETHQGIYDSAFLMTMPYLVIYSPGSLSELRAMLKIALKREEPAAIRYNRGTMLETLDNTEVIFGKWSKLKELRSVTLFATGAMLPLALKIASEHQIGLVNMRFLKPLDTEMLDECVRNGTKILVLEDSITAVAKEIALYCNKNIVHSISIPGCPVTQGTILQQRDRFGLNEKEIIKRLQVLEEL
jgi:1-deoxy-D-xylulose-5-phosphate synthase